MCRHIGYLGPPVPVGEILTRGTHSLRTQSWAPREMRGGGTINADGFGVAWWVPGGTEPPVTSRYRNAAPIWTDPAVDEVLPQIHSGAVVAAIRSATVGLPVERAACAPFTHGHWAFSHNGAIPNWRETLTTLAVKFDSPPLLEAESLTDSAALWVILRGLLETVDAATALRQIVTAVLEYSPTARLNLLLSDGETLWATTWHHSLSVLVTDTFAVLSSEPYDDDPRWRPIGDRQLVVAAPGRVTVEALDNEPGRATP